MYVSAFYAGDRRVLLLSFALCLWSNLGVRVLQLGVPLFRFIPPILQTLQEKGVGAFPLLFTMHGTKSVVLTYFFKQMNEGHERP